MVLTEAKVSYAKHYRVRVAASTASKEIVWLRQLLKDLDCKVSTPTILYVDKQSAIRLVNNPEFHKRTKHIDIKFHFI